MVEARGRHTLESFGPWVGIAQGNSVTDLSFFRIELDMVSGRSCESNPLSGRLVLTGGNAFDFASEIRNGFSQLVQGSLAVHLEPEIIHTRCFCLSQNDTVMIMLVPRL